jgi:spermidine synthase
LAALILAGAGLTSGGSDDLAQGVLAVRESPYQRVRVVEQETGWRTLEVNERRGSFQSVWRPEVGLLGPGYYYDAFALPAHWSEPVGDWSTLVLGLGSGTAWRVLEGALPEGVSLSGTGVELDPVVIDLAREFMELHDSSSNHTVLSGWDARAVLGPLGRGDERWDQIIVDVYANQVEIPAHLATVEFYESAAGLLAATGWLQVNVGASGVDDPLALAVASSMAFAFSSPTLALGVPFSRNVILLQRQGADLVLPGNVGFVPNYEPLEELASRMSLSGTWRLVGPEDGRLLHDGDAPLEDLQRASLAGMGAL